MAIACGCLISCSDKKTDDAKYHFTETIRSSAPQTPEAERAGFRLPDGFDITLFASEPQIGKPININFDARGRMWVTQSSSYPVPAEKGKAQDKITILEDTDNDGKADRFTDFSDTLNVPIGVLPTQSGAIAFSIPNIYEFRDADKNGKGEFARPMIGGFGFVDTHGMVSNFIRGYDGWVYACHGFTNKSTVSGADGDSITLISGNVFRFRMDGSRIEQMTFGQVNPFGLVYDELGYLYSTDSHTSPLYQLIRGGNYPHFGKEELMAFGPDMKPLEDEATALCGITQYADTKFPTEFHGNFFVGDAVKSIVHRYSSVFKGSSPVGKSEEDFILSADPWFRPVNIKLGPDGALYVADFYNAIIGHYEVPLGHPQRDKIRGRIWRITYKGNVHEKMDLSVSSMDQLVQALDHDNLPTRMDAMHEIVDRVGATAVPRLHDVLQDRRTSPRKFIHAMWSLERLGALTVDALHRSMDHPSPLVRLHALRVTREMNIAPDLAHGITLKSLTDTDEHVRRAAAEMLTKFEDMNSLENALHMVKHIPAFDSHLMYTVRLTIRNLLRSNDVLADVLEKQWAGDDASVIAEALLEVNSLAAAVFLDRFLSEYALSDSKTPLAYRQMAIMLPRSAVHNATKSAMERYKNNTELATNIFKNVLRGIQQRAEKLPHDFLKTQATGIATQIFGEYPANHVVPSKEALAHQTFAVELAGDFAIRSLQTELMTLLNLNSHDKESLQLRTAAFRSLVQLSIANADLAADILANENEPLEFRKHIAKVLGEFPGQRVNEILQNVENAPPALQPAIVTSMAVTEEGKDIIFRQVRRGKIQARVLLEPQIEERILLNISQAQQDEYKDLIASLQPVSAEKEKLIHERIASFRSIDQTSELLDSGRIIFNRYCSACHRRANQIGIGPQLHGIGKRGAEAIIEKVLDPNRNISKAFQTYTIRLSNGKVLVGLYRRDEGEALVFADMAGKEFAVPKRDIETKEASKYTVMPDNFSESISPKDLNALITYLLTW